MKKQIVHISIHQTSKVIAAMHAAMMTVLFILPSVLGYWYQGHVILGMILLILLPLFMWILMYIGYVVACWFYNLVVPWTGGIEVEVLDAGMSPERNVVAAPALEEDVVVNSEDVVITPPTDKKNELEKADEGSR